MSNQKSMLAAIGALVCQLDTGNVRDRLEAALRGDKPKPPAERDVLRQLAVSGDEAARMLSVTRRTVVNLSREGVLKRVVLPGRRRAVGYTRASVEAVAAGGAA